MPEANFYGFNVTTTTLTIDIIEAIHKLRDAGFNEKQAETIVRIVTESGSNLVTREYIDARLELLESRLTIKLGSFIMLATGILMAYQQLFAK